MRKDFVQILYSLGSGNICMLLSNKIPQSVYLIENVKIFADEVFFKQSYFFSFFSIFFIYLLALNEKGTKQPNEKLLYFRSGETLS